MTLFDAPRPWMRGGHHSFTPRAPDAPRVPCVLCRKPADLQSFFAPAEPWEWPGLIPESPGFYYTICAPCTDVPDEAPMPFA